MCLLAAVLKQSGMRDRRATVPPIVKNCIYCAEKVAQGLDLISPYFYFYKTCLSIEKKKANL